MKVMFESNRKIEKIQERRGSIMKKLIIVLIALSAVSMIGCEEETTTRYIEVDNPPAVPQGVYSVTGDEVVYIHWLPVQDEDLSHYRVWWSDEADGLYELMGTSDTELYIDRDVVNGTTYFYAVSAVDKGGKESELSYETVFDTPRPQGEDCYMYDYHIEPAEAGFDFSAESNVQYDSPAADIFVDYDVILETFFINVADTLVDIQDMGYTYHFDEIGYAPDTGWSVVGWVEAIEGHTYVVWTADNHFAKLRVTHMTASRIYFDWAYQVAAGNLELARPQHDEGYMTRTIGGTIIK
jgi:hypothetical protein